MSLQMRTDAINSLNGPFHTDWTRESTKYRSSRPISSWPQIINKQPTRRSLQYSCGLSRTLYWLIYFIICSWMKKKCKGFIPLYLTYYFDSCDCLYYVIRHIVYYQIHQLDLGPNYENLYRNFSLCGRIHA